MARDKPRLTLDSSKRIVGTVEVTREEQRKCSRNLRNDLRDAQKKVDAQRNDAQLIGVNAMSEVARVFDLPAMDPNELPFKMHASHTKTLYLGGFAACERCGRIASQNRQGNALIAECRKYCPRGSASRLKRMRQGQHPQGKDEWPDGSTNPLPRRIRAA